MAKNTPIEEIHLETLKGRAKYNKVVDGTVKTLEGTGATGYSVNLDNECVIVQIQILFGTVVFTTDGQVPVASGAIDSIGSRWLVAGDGSESWATLSKQEARALQVIALTGQTPRLNIIPKALAIKH